MAWESQSASETEIKKNKHTDRKKVNIYVNDTTINRNILNNNNNDPQHMRSEVEKWKDENKTFEVQKMKKKN